MKSFTLLVALTACSTTPPPQSPTSRGMRADEHLDAARDHARRADELSRWPDIRRNDDRVTGTGTWSGPWVDPSTGIWYSSIDQTQDQKRLADTHRSEAAAILAEYEQACANIPPERIRVSPLQRYGVGGAPIDDGAVFYLGTNAGTPERLLAEMRCHRAWMMLSQPGQTGMESCPLDLPNINVNAYGDATGVSVEIHVKDPLLVPELQRRAAQELEIAKRHQPAR